MCGMRVGWGEWDELGRTDACGGWKKPKIYILEMLFPFHWRSIFLFQLFFATFSVYIF